MRFSFSSVACHLLNYRVPLKIIHWKYQHILPSEEKRAAVDKMHCTAMWLLLHIWMSRTLQFAIEMRTTREFSIELFQPTFIFHYRAYAQPDPPEQETKSQPSTSRSDSSSAISNSFTCNSRHMNSYITFGDIMSLVIFKEIPFPKCIPSAQIGFEQSFRRLEWIVTCNLYRDDFKNRSEYVQQALAQMLVNRSLIASLVYMNFFHTHIGTLHMHVSTL